MDAADSHPQAPPTAQRSPTPADSEPNKVRRVNKACLNCRKRKSRCHLDDNGEVPCLRCKRENLECVLGGSNRGGRRVRKKIFESQLSNPIAFGQEDQGGFHGVGTVGTVNTWGSQQMPNQPPHEPRPYRGELQLPETDRSRSLSSEQLPFSKLQNPSDALGILAQVAETSTGDDGSGHRRHLSNGRHISSLINATSPSSGMSYPPLDDGHVSLSQVEWLIRRYRENYHPYYPLAPIDALDVTRLRETAANEPHLLTAILVVSSKDLTEQPHIYEACAKHMKSLVSNLAAGGEGGLEAVEALLILAEWAPYTQRSESGNVGRGEEDKESWMHVGVALRISYFLGLDRFSFRVVEDGKDPDFNRKRLIWTACYMSDKQISIRIGKAFWSRGPGPLTSLGREDYTTLLPKHSNDEDYASIFQANLELTSLFSNVHDVLYSNPGSSFRSHLSGGYIKFIDDFRSAIYGWKSVWGTLTCSPHLKAMLLMSYDYLRLYTNAFAFQATIRRALPQKDPSKSSAEYQAPSRVFYNNVASVGDVRFIYEGLDAAKAILSTVNNFVDAEKSLRFMPLRIYLYLVYSGVFLYRARCVGVMGQDEERAIRQMVTETVSRLQRAGTGPLHPGSRYSQLLKLLWQKVSTKDKVRLPTLQNPSSMGARAGDAPASMVSPGASLMGSSPATEQMGDFAWTDLMAVGDFAVNGYNATGQQGSNDDGFLSGFLPMDLNNAWDVGQFDANGNAGPMF